MVTISTSMTEEVVRREIVEALTKKDTLYSTSVNAINLISSLLLLTVETNS